ncbi:MAG: hypothetical protein KGI59_00700, partial [Patescibacteria group bacterium]|nr:hypothetical protein [Patescibacteria group bacterium]
MSKISTGEWVAVYCIAGIIDIVQWFLIPLVGADTIADPFIGILFALYFQLRGVSMTRRISRLVSLVGTTALEEFSFSIAPAWIVDVWYIHRSVRQEDA